jgi:hypothetical protein
MGIWSVANVFGRHGIVYAKICKMNCVPTYRIFLYERDSRVRNATRHQNEQFPGRRLRCDRVRWMGQLVHRISVPQISTYGITWTIWHTNASWTQEMISLSLSMAVQPFEPRPLLQFLNPRTVSRTPWTGDQPVKKPLPTKLKKLNSVAFSPQANYTDWATAACRRS